jgi:hypothetical protein
VCILQEDDELCEELVEMLDDSDDELKLELSELVLELLKLELLDDSDDELKLELLDGDSFEEILLTEEEEEELEELELVEL